MKFKAFAISSTTCCNPVIT